MKKVIGLVLVAVLVVAAGCVTSSPRVHNGMLIGASIGAGAGLVNGSRSGHVAGLGLLGAAAGAVAGGIADAVLGSAPAPAITSTPAPVSPSYGGGDSAYWEGYHQEKNRMAREEAQRQRQSGRNAARMGW